MNFFSSDSIIPSTIHDISYLGREQTFEVINCGSTSLQSSNSDLSQILDSNSTFGTLGSSTLDGFYLSDGVWDAGDEKQCICSMINSSLPQRIPTSNNDSLLSTDNATDTTAISAATTTPGGTEPNVNTERQSEPISEDSCPPLTKKRRRFRKKKAHPSQAQLEAKRSKFLERNRIAASKCRRKKKVEMDSLENKRLEAETENAALKTQLDTLRCELNLCKHAIMAHASCNHLDVTAWIEHNAACLPSRGEEICPSLIGGTSSIDGSGSRRASIGSTLRSSIFSEDGGIESLSCASITSSSSFSTSPCPVPSGIDRRATIECGELDSEADPGFGDNSTLSRQAKR